MIQNMVKVGFFIGLICVLLAGYLAFFTELMDSMGTNGILIISLVAGFGLLLLVPSKIYLMIMYFQKKEPGSKKSR
tara:strand:- start:51468 stop:51695 length:228 start_codon:yes stop_codon:yes gene_type:complete